MTPDETKAHLLTVLAALKELRDTTPLTSQRKYIDGVLRKVPGGEKGGGV